MDHVACSTYLARQGELTYLVLKKIKASTPYSVEIRRARGTSKSNGLTAELGSNVLRKAKSTTTPRVESRRLLSA